MRLTVLGRYGPFPAPGGACSSYLLEAPALPGKTGPGDPTVRIVIELGAGSLSRLLAVCPLSNIDAVLLSHLHSDHMSDMLVLRYTLQQMHARGIPVPMPLHVVAPDEPEPEYRMLASSGTFNMVRAEEGMKLRFGALSITLHRMLHPVPSYAMDILEEEPKKFPVFGKNMPPKRLVYTGDTGMNPHLPIICRDAAMLLVDTGQLEVERNIPAAPHLTARQAGELARNAGAGRLIMTHIWGGGMEEEQMQADARTFFPASEIAREMATYEV